MYFPSLRHKHLERSTEAQLVFNLCSLQDRRDAFHCDFATCFPLLPPANEFWGKVMFLHMSVNGEGGLCMMSLSVRLPGPMFLLGFSVSGPIFLRGGLSRRWSLHRGQIWGRISGSFYLSILTNN